MVWYGSIPKFIGKTVTPCDIPPKKKHEKQQIFSRFSATVIPWQVWLLAPLWCFTVPSPRATSALPCRARGRQLEAEDFVELLERPEGAQDLQEKLRLRAARMDQLLIITMFQVVISD